MAIPLDALRIIFSFLDVDDCARLQRVSRDWFSMAFSGITQLDCTTSVVIARLNPIERVRALLALLSGAVLLEDLSFALFNVSDTDGVPSTSENFFDHAAVKAVLHSCRHRLKRLSIHHLGFDLSGLWFYLIDEMPHLESFEWRGDFRFVSLDWKEMPHSATSSSSTPSSRRVSSSSASGVSLLPKSSSLPEISLLQSLQHFQHQQPQQLEEAEQQHQEEEEEEESPEVDEYDQEQEQDAEGSGEQLPATPMTGEYVWNFEGFMSGGAIEDDEFLPQNQHFSQSDHIGPAEIGHFLYDGEQVHDPGDENDGEVAFSSDTSSYYRALKLSYSIPPLDEIPSIVRFLLSCPNIKTLRLISLSDLELMCYLAYGIPSSLTHLEIQHCEELTDKSISLLAKSPCGSRLRTLILRRCALVSYSALVSIATHCRSLTQLIFDPYTRTNTATLEASLIDSASLICSPLSMIGSTVRLSSSGLVRFCQSLIDNPHCSSSIQHLRLAYPPSIDESLPLLARLSELQFLDLSHSTSTHLACLSELHHLRELKLERCVGLQETDLIKILGANKKIQSLDIRGCLGLRNLHFSQFSTLANGLQVLRFGSPSLSDSALLHISRGCKQLRELHFQGIAAVTADGFGHIASNLQFMETLVIEQYARTDIAELADALANGRIAKSLRHLRLARIHALQSDDELAASFMARLLKGLKRLKTLNLRDGAGFYHAPSFERIGASLGARLQKLQLAAENSEHVADETLQRLAVECPSLSVRRSTIFPNGPLYIIQD